ncbi:o-succinylbenzoate synthase [Weissella viridescens]|uniref:O-succinylbenzoate synthase n=1 Tax=Weissella viridescens TaxID=1629 RepID=A0A380NZI3_WEIVI|nr:o-succinylbenzoate synthase [Weissella viridescens]
MDWGMLSSGLGRFVDVTLAATLPNPIFPADIAATQDGLELDVIYEPIQLIEGRVEVPQKPGVGITVNWTAVKNYKRMLRKSIKPFEWKFGIIKTNRLKMEAGYGNENCECAQSI